ncbi:MAG: vitamin K epoxide reductase family protein [Saprospiraceae bacterium]
MRKELYQLLAQLLNSHRIRVNEAELKLQLQSHPSYPSLHALTGVLNHFGITNLALQVPVQADVLPELPDYFIANLMGAKEKQLMLVAKQQNRWEIFDDTDKVQLLDQASFLQRWDGIILAVEKEETALTEAKDEPSFFSTKILFVGLFLLMAYFIAIQGNLFASLHFLLSIIGFAFSVLIVQHELGFTSPTTDRFCQQSEKTSCDDVLLSKGAKILNFLKLSDLSIVIFGSYILYWTFYFLTTALPITLIVLLSWSAIPVVLYSLYYQRWVVQKWCPLCLAIAGVLVLQAVSVFTSDFSFAMLSLSLKTGLIFLFSTLIAIGTWKTVKDLLAQKKELGALKLKHFKFKRNFSIFQALHQRGESLNASIDIPQEIVLGAFDAPLEIILVTNPRCFYCKEAHQDISKVLKSASDQLKLIIRFNFREIDQEDIGYQVAAQLLHIFATQGKSAVEKALDEVYHAEVALPTWLAQQTGNTKNAYESSLRTQAEWCRTHGINFTPALFVAGKQFPVEYDRGDLIYFVEELIEQNEIDVVLSD